MEQVFIRDLKVGDVVMLVDEKLSSVVSITQEADGWIKVYIPGTADRWWRPDHGSATVRYTVVSAASLLSAKEQVEHQLEQARDAIKAMCNACIHVCWARVPKTVRIASGYVDEPNQESEAE